MEQAFEITLRNIPGTNNIVSLPQGSTVADLAEHVANFSGSVVRVNGAQAAESTPLKSGDEVTTSKAAKGA